MKIETPRTMRIKIIAAFAAIYFLWGSTYLAIRFAVQTIPPFLQAGSRFIVTGILLYTWARRSGSEPPQPRHWRDAAIVGALLLLGGVGGVSWAEQWVPSGVTSLIAATVPMWMVLMDWLRRGGHRPGLRVVLGVIIGFAGLTLLVGAHNVTGGGPIDRVGATVLLVGSVAWAAGSLYSRYGSFPESPVLTTSMQMMTGSVMLLCVSLFTGEWTRIQWEQISRASLIAYVYLLTISTVAFIAYIWLLKVSTPARTATHAYVNPVVAVFLAWLIGGELLTKKIILAATIIVSSVAMITTYETGGTGDKAEPG